MSDDARLTARARRAIAGEPCVLLPLGIEHAGAVAGLPFHHRDPFDRLLVTQALREEMSIVSADKVFRRYGVKRIW